MKMLLTIAACFLPSATWAQSVDNGNLKPRSAELAPRQSIEQVLAGSINPRVLELATRTVLYRQLGDTVGNRYARQLRPGDCVVVRKTLPHWFAVCRATGPTQFSNDTATYYMPKTGTKGAKTFVLL
ncbi:hypothetical protein [Hymenobacter persicinus]|uniref:SH3 domain-containing protein n=1 Tax=Hymenobacter persicinus TaxID=2025506 RepID=A0A4Q5LA34_9BACT|nr:hypothetical protein [Hymenobacter persicinus]RYU78728.1 hypothetical protein EWM57_13105 [Hymenobacter persicinus]